MISFLLKYFEVLFLGFWTHPPCSVGLVVSYALLVLGYFVGNPENQDLQEIDLGLIFFL